MPVPPRRAPAEPSQTSAWIKRGDQVEQLNVPRHVDEAREVTKPITIAPPMFSASISSEIQNAFRDYAERHNEAEAKNREARHVVARVDQLFDDVSELKAAQAVQRMLSEKTNELLTQINVGFSNMRKDVAKLQRSSARKWVRIKELETDRSAIWQSIRAHGERLDVLEQDKRDNAQQKLGQQKLITKGKVAAVAGFSFFGYLATKWQWIVSHLK